MATITINGISIDPVSDAPMMAAKGLAQADATDSNYILVQTSHPLTAGERKQLAAVGAEPIEFVPNDTYICAYAAPDLQPVRALPFVAWTNVYLRGFKVAPELHAAVQAKAAHLLDLKGLTYNPRDPAKLVDVVLHRSVAPSAVAAEVAKAAGFDPKNLTPGHGKFRLRVQPDRLDALAQLDVVRSIEPVFEKRLWNSVARKLLDVNPVQAAGSLQGSGQIVAVCDTGFDLGNAATPHPAFTGRIVKLYALGRAAADDPDGHGTHVCGSVLGSGSSPSLGDVHGTAPQAKLIMQSVLDPQGGLGGLPANLGTLFDAPYADGARVHTNSWGDGNNAYGQDAHDVDTFVWTHRDSVILFAAGNDGVDHDKDGAIDNGSIGSPGTAKNCITVGASENDRPTFQYVDGAVAFDRYGQGWPSDYPVNPLHDDKLTDNPSGLAAFSSRGPTADGRIKPDVVAPGTGILSTRSRAAGVGNGWGPSPDPLYFYDGGTSMSTPLVAGCAAVVREHLLCHFPAPSAALVKAVLINGADALSGQYTPSEAGVVPNSHQGFGRVNLAASVDAAAHGRFIGMWDESTALDTGDSCTFHLAVPAGNLKVTLVWTDPPGSGLQNDLDLVVTANGVTALGNAAPGSQVADRSNNVEQVLLPALAASNVTITVTAYRAALHPQTFALVARVYQ